MSKKQPTNNPQYLLDADEALQIAADQFAEEDNDDTKNRLREAARAFSEAWAACGSGKGRP